MNKEAAAALKEVQQRNNREFIAAKKLREKEYAKQEIIDM